jgi:hypothetical protein
LGQQEVVAQVKFQLLLDQEFFTLAVAVGLLVILQGLRVLVVLVAVVLEALFLLLLMELLELPTQAVAVVVVQILEEQVALAVLAS